MKAEELVSDPPLCVNFCCNEVLLFLVEEYCIKLYLGALHSTA